jgi:hypothetical protein
MSAFGRAYKLVFSQKVASTSYQEMFLVLVTFIDEVWQRKFPVFVAVSLQRLEVGEGVGSGVDDGGGQSGQDFGP